MRLVARLSPCLATLAVAATCARYRAALDASNTPDGAAATLGAAIATASPEACDDKRGGPNNLNMSPQRKARTRHPKAAATMRWIFGEARWFAAAACGGFCLDANVLVMGDSVDAQLFHALEAATAAGRASRRVLAQSGWKEIIVVTKILPEFGGGKLFWCRDDDYRTLQPPPAPKGHAYCKAWRRNATRSFYGHRVDVVVMGDNARYAKRDGDGVFLRPFNKLSADDVAAHAARLEAQIRVVRATGALPIVRTLPPTNLVWDASRRRLNRAAIDVAARTRVPLIRLDAFVEHVLEQGARRVGVAAAYAFVEVRWPTGGVRGLGAACSEPLTFGAARRLPNATWRRPTLALEAYGDVNRRPRCLGVPYAMTDGAHFSPDVYAFWGILALDAIRAARRENATRVLPPPRLALGSVEV